MRIEIPTGWTAVARRLMEAGGTAMVLGARDTGKSTFASWLAAHATARGVDTWLVDSDVGQSDVGPPTTVGAARVPPPTVAAPPVPDKGDTPLASDRTAGFLWFVGSHSPRAHMLDCVLGTGRLVHKARSQGGRLVIVNTTGWVEGGAAAALKTAKIDLVRPRFLVVLERDGELRDVLDPWRHATCLEIVRCDISDAVSPRPQERRIEARRERWARYLGAAREIVLDVRQVGISGAPRARLWDPRAVGCAVGLLDGSGECVGVGPLVGMAVSEPFVRVLAPVARGHHIARLHLGSAVVPGYEPVLPAPPDHDSRAS